MKEQKNMKEQKYIIISFVYIFFLHEIIIM
jgi:hypothetical protein